MRFLLNMVFVLLGFFSIVLSVAQAGDGVGNGSVVVDGDRYELADLHFQPHRGEFYIPDGPLLRQLNKLRNILDVYTGQHLIGDSQLDMFFDEFILRDDVVYSFVKELPKGCDDTVKIAGKVTQLFGCTQGHVTWIIPSRFQPLDIEQKASGLVHERLHAYMSNEPHEVISPFVKGTVLLQKLERLSAKQSIFLNAEDRTTLEAFLLAGDQLGLFTQHSRVNIQNKGGGNWINVSQLLDGDDKTCQFIQCAVNGHTYIGVNAVVFNSEVIAPLDLKIKGTINDEFTIPSYKTFVARSVVSASGLIENSQVDRTQLGLDESSTIDIRNSKITGVILAGGQVYNSVLKPRFNHPHAQTDMDDGYLWSMAPIQKSHPIIGDGFEALLGTITMANAASIGDNVKIRWSDLLIYQLGSSAVIERTSITNTHIAEIFDAVSENSYPWEITLTVGDNSTLRQFHFKARQFAGQYPKVVVDANLNIANCNITVPDNIKNRAARVYHFKTNSCEYEIEY